MCPRHGRPRLAGPRALRGDAAGGGVLPKRHARQPRLNDEVGLLVGANAVGNGADEQEVGVAARAWRLGRQALRHAPGGVGSRAAARPAGWRTTPACRRPRRSSGSQVPRSSSSAAGTLAWRSAASPRRARHSAATSPVSRGSTTRPAELGAALRSGARSGSLGEESRQIALADGPPRTHITSAGTGAARPRRASRTTHDFRRYAGDHRPVTAAP